MSAIGDVYRPRHGIGGSRLRWLGYGMGAVTAVLAARWAVWYAVFLASNPADCPASGACWAVATSQWKLVLFGIYPFGEIWRPAVATLVLVGVFAIATLRPALRTLAYAWLAGIVAALSLFDGRPLGLAYVEPHEWGGLPLTLLLSEATIVLAFPIGLALALARCCDNLFLRSLALVLVEAIRGVPLVSLLFFATLVLPLFLSGLSNLDKLYGAAIAIILFNGAYISEVFRGGLLSVHHGQHEAARALGLRWRAIHRLVILPQVYKACAPSLINQAVGIVKDTSLLAVLGIFDFMNSAKLTLVDIRWRENFVEVYVLVGLAYFAMCTSVSFLGRRLAAPTMGKEPIRPIAVPTAIPAGGQA